MRRRLRRWLFGYLIDTQRGEISTRVGFVSRQTVILLLLLSPLIIVVLVLAATIAETLALALLVLLLPLPYGMLVLSMLLAYGLPGYLGTPFWRGPEKWLMRLSQIETPTPRRGEAVISSFLVSRPTWWLWSVGRLTLTSRRLVYQEARLRVLPPWKPGRRSDFELPDVASVSGVVPTSFRAMLAAGRFLPVLSVVSRDGKRLDLTIMAARGWATAIRKARRELVERTSQST